ncbi:MAG: thioredoxin [Acidobacteriota bacterium]
MDSDIVRCAQCGSLNRINQDRLRGGREPVCGQCRNILELKDSSAHPVRITDANFNELVGKAATPVFIDFWAGWCGPCLMIGPFIEELARDLAGRVLVGKLNVDENPDTAARYRVTSIPTMIIFEKGLEVGRLTGAAPKEAMVAKLRSLGLL